MISAISSRLAGRTSSPAVSPKPQKSWPRSVRTASSVMISTRPATALVNMSASELPAPTTFPAVSVPISIISLVRVRVLPGDSEPCWVCRAVCLKPLVPSGPTDGASDGPLVRGGRRRVRVALSSFSRAHELTGCSPAARSHRSFSALVTRTTICSIALLLIRKPRSARTCHTPTLSPTKRAAEDEFSAYDKSS